MSTYDNYKQQDAGEMFRMHMIYLYARMARYWRQTVFKMPSRWSTSTQVQVHVEVLGISADYRDVYTADIVWLAAVAYRWQLLNTS